MCFVVYDVESTRYAFSNKSVYSTEAAAKAAITRAGNKGDSRELDYAEYNLYHESIEKQVERKNLMSGKTYMESVNTPNYMSPSREAYWSM